MQIAPENAEDERNRTIASAFIPFPEPTKTISISCGFENMYEKVLCSTRSLLSPEVRVQVMDEYTAS